VEARDMTEQRLRIRSMPLVPAIVTGAWSGFVPGLFIGGAAGAIASFAAGAALEWMRELSFTTGIQEQLLPFGDRVGELQTVQDDWFIVIPLAGVAVGLVAALIGALTGALVAATYGSLLGGVEVVVEEATRAEAVVAEPVKEVRRRRARRRTDSAA
jgi:hypothetical protein